MDTIHVAVTFLVLVSAIISPLDWIIVFYNPIAQLVAAVITIIVLLFVNPLAGLLLGLSLLVIYYRLYHDTVMARGWGSGEPRTEGPMARLVSQYITPKHLEDAQNNIVGDYDKEMIGITGVYGEPVYSAQGIDKMMPGFEAPAQLTGTPVDFSTVPGSTLFG